MASSNEIRDDYVFRATLEDQVSGPAGKLAASLDTVGDSADGAKTALDSINQANQAVAAGLDRIASSGQVGTRTFNNMVRSLDPYTAGLNAAVARQEQLNRSIAAGNVPIEQQGRLQELAAQKVEAAEQKLAAFNQTMGQHVAVNNQAQFAIRQASVQMTQFATSVATGTQILTAFIQQGHQLYDVALVTGTGFGVLTQAINQAVRSIGGWPVAAVLAIGAGLAAIGAYAESTNRRLGDLRDQLSASRSDYASLADAVEKSARQLAATTSASFSEATQAAKTLASTTAFSGTQQDLANLTRTAEDLSKVMGTSLPDAAKLMARAMTDPSAALKELASGTAPLQSVTVALRLQVDELQREGKYADAARLAIDALKQSASIAPQQLTPLQKALNDLSAAFNKAGEDGRSFAQHLGDTITNAATFAVNAITTVITALEKMRSVAFSGPSGGPLPQAALEGQFDVPGGGLAAAQQPSAVGAKTVADEVALRLQQSLQFQYPSLYSQRGSPLYGPMVPGQGQAVGLMQLMPGTYGSLGYSDQFVGGSAGNNLIAGLSYINQLYERGLSSTAIGNVYGGATTPATQAARQSALGSAQIGQLPSDVSGGIEFIGHIFNWPDWLITLAKQTAYVESRGQQFTSPSSIAAAAGPQGAVGGAQSLGGGSIYGGGQANRLGQQGIDVANNLDLQRDKVAKLTAGLDALKAAREAAQQAQDPKEVDRLTAAITKQQDAIESAINPLRRETEALQDQAKIDDLLGKANQDLARIYLEAARARQSGEGPTDAQVQQKVIALTNDQTAAFNRQIAVIDQNIEAANKQAEAWQGGAVAYAKATAAAEAHKQVQDTLASATHDTAAAEAVLTQKLLEQAAGQEKIKAAQESSQIQDQISLLQLESSTLGQDNDQRSLQIQHLRDEIDLRNKYPNLIAAGNEELIKERDALAQNQLVLRQQTQSLDYVANQFSSAFDTIGDAITQSLVQGQGAAVNFGNVMQAVAAQVLQAFLRLAVINPLINSLFGGMNGQTLPTFDSLFGALGAGQGGGGGILGGIGNIFGSGLFGTSTAEAAAAGGGLPLFGPATAEQVAATGVSDAGLATNLGISNLGTGGAAATGLFGGASIGSLIGGVGAGFGLGSLVGGTLQSSLGKTGPGPKIGAGVGALGGLAAGAALGSVVPVVGTIIGAVVGGLLGGVIGPKKPSPYAATYVGIGANGELTVDPSLSGNQITASNLADIQKQAADFNTQLATAGVRITGTGKAPPAGAPGGLGFFGTAENMAGFAGFNIQDQFSNLRFGAAAGTSPVTADVINRNIGGLAYGSMDQLATAVGRIKTFVEQTVPALEKFGGAMGSLRDAVDNIRGQFDPAINTAHQLGFAEQELTDARDKAIRKAEDAVSQQLADLQGNYAARFSAAAAIISNNPQDAAAASLQAFDLQADQERRNLSDQLTGIFGDTVKGTELFNQQMSGLERTLQEERLAAAKQANAAAEQLYDQAKQQASAMVTQISDYVRGLQGSTLSPLSPQSQLDLANRQFSAVFGSAAAGNAESISKITSYADSYLNAARQVYGSGQGYVDVFNNVVNALQRVAEVPADTLTASVFAIETRSQTDSLVSAIESLQNEVAGLRAQVASGSAMPSRLAA